MWTRRKRKIIDSLIKRKFNTKRVDMLTDLIGDFWLKNFGLKASVLIFGKVGNIYFKVEVINFSLGRGRQSWFSYQLPPFL